MGTLFVVATPIGNLEDISLRALRILREVKTVVAEDSRVVGKLLHHFGIKKPILIFHEHSDNEKLKLILERLKRGEDLAYLTDAGTPGVSDPGWRIADACHKEGIKVVPIPGPSALPTLLSVSGLPVKEFLFLGFLPKKKGRQTLFLKLRGETRPIVIFESPHRLLKTLQDFKNYLGDREAVVGRELTKKFEEVKRGKISHLIEEFAKRKQLKGEITLIIG